MPDEKTIYIPSENQPTPHLLLGVEDEEKAESALRQAQEKWSGRLGVTRNFDESVDGEHIGNVIVGHNEYAVYQL